MKRIGKSELGKGIGHNGRYLHTMVQKLFNSIILMLLNNPVLVNNGLHRLMGFY